MLLIRRAFRLFGLQNDNSGRGNMENETGNPFIPHVTDVLNVKSTLWRKKLPVELIDSIVDFAEYWPRVVTSVENTITIGNDGNFLYIQSQPLPGLFVLESSGEGGEREELVVGGIESGTLNPARKIVFRIWSHDQGWSSNPGRGVSPTLLGLFCCVGSQN